MSPMDLDRKLRQPERYWNIDGLPLLGMGALWLAIGAGCLMVEWAQGPWKLTLMVLMVGGGFWLNGLLKRLKRHITEPRTGAIRIRESTSRWRMRLFAGAVGTCVALAFPLFQRSQQAHIERALPATIGLLIAGEFFFAWRRYQLPTYALVGLVSLIAGLALSAAKIEFADSLLWFFVVLGAVSMLCGAHDLRAYLRAHPKAAEEGSAL